MRRSTSRENRHMTTQDRGGYSDNSTFIDYTRRLRVIISHLYIVIE